MPGYGSPGGGDNESSHQQHFREEDKTYFKMNPPVFRCKLQKKIIKHVVKPIL
jgi:hypothetical protein